MATFAHKRSAYGVFLALPLLAALAFPANAQTWKINLRDADLTAFVNEVADITGKNFAVDPRVKGTVTVISNKALTRDQVYDLFLGVLNVNGVVAVPSGNTIKLVPDTNARGSGTPFDSRSKIRGELIVTRVIWLANTNPNDLIPAIRPLMPQYAHLAAIPGTNALIISDRAENIEQIEKLVRTLDGTGEDDMEAITLRNSQAEEIIGLVDAMSATGASRDVRGSRVRLIADARSNRLLVKGDAQSRKRIRDLVQLLDVAPADRLGGLRVFRLKHASAKNLAQMLQGLVTGQNSSSSGSGSSNNNSSFSNTSNNTANNSSTTGSTGSGISSVNLTSLGNNSNSSNNNALTSFSAGGISIIADETQNALIVKSEPALMREIESAIEQLDSRRSQVLIEAAIVEVSGSNIDQLGIQWALGDLTSGVGLINFNNVGASLAGIGVAAAAGAAGAGAAANSLLGAALALGDVREKNGQTSFYGALIQALDRNTKANLLSVPSVLTLDNEEAHIVVGQNVPFITGSTTLTSGGTSSPYQTVERKDVGLTLKVIPHIGEGGTIRLEVEQEVSAVVPASSAVSTTDITTTKRLIKTAILAEDQQTIVLGGLIQDDNTNSEQAVPGLSKIPVLGRLFRSDNKTNEKRNLLVFLHPTIVRDGKSVNSLTQKRYGQVRSLQFLLDPDGNMTRLPEQIDRIYGDSTTSTLTNSALGSKDPTPVALDPNVNTSSLNSSNRNMTGSNTTRTTALAPAPVVVVRPLVDMTAQPAVAINPPVTTTSRDGNTVIQTTIRSE